MKKRLIYVSGFVIYILFSSFQINVLSDNDFITLTGTYVDFNIPEEHFGLNFKEIFIENDAVRITDIGYKILENITGTRPYSGKKILIKAVGYEGESNKPRYVGRAGNPITIVYDLYSIENSLIGSRRDQYGEIEWRHPSFSLFFHEMAHNFLNEMNYIKNIFYTHPYEEGFVKLLSSYFYKLLSENQVKYSIPVTTAESITDYYEIVKKTHLVGHKHHKKGERSYRLDSYIVDFMFNVSERFGWEQTPIFFKNLKVIANVINCLNDIERNTFFIALLSYTFNYDLRTEFSSLLLADNEIAFPIDDNKYFEYYAKLVNFLSIEPITGVTNDIKINEINVVNNEDYSIQQNLWLIGDGYKYWVQNIILCRPSNNFMSGTFEIYDFANFDIFGRPTKLLDGKNLIAEWQESKSEIYLKTYIDNNYLYLINSFHDKYMYELPSFSLISTNDTPLQRSNIVFTAFITNIFDIILDDRPTVSFDSNTNGYINTYLRKYDDESWFSGEQYVLSIEQSDTNEVSKNLHFNYPYSGDFSFMEGWEEQGFWFKIKYDTEYKLENDNIIPKTLMEKVIILLKCPIDIMLKDSKNRTTGFNTLNNLIIEEIPNSMCFIFNKSKMVILFNLNETYELSLLSYDEGNYTLKIDYIDSNYSDINLVNLNSNINETQTSVILATIDNGSVIMSTSSLLEPEPSPSPSPEPSPSPSPEPSPSPSPEPSHSPSPEISPSLSPKPESPGGIPGFSIEAVLVGVLLSVLLIWYSRR